MKSHRSLIGGVIVWGLLGAGIYTAVNMTMHYLSKTPTVPEPLKVSVDKFKDVSVKTADKIKSSVLPEKQQRRSLPEANRPDDRTVVQSDQKTEDCNSPLKRLGRIADTYMDEELGGEDIPEEESVQMENRKTDNIDNRETTAAPEAESEEILTMHDKEKKVFARQLSVIDDLLE